MTPQLVQMMPSIPDHDISNHLARSGTFLQSQNFYNTGRNAIYSRYTTTDWDTSNKAHFSLSEKERSLAERLRTEAWRAVKATDTQTRNRQAANTKRLNERVGDISFWKEELITEIRCNENEMECMAEHIRVLERALGDTKTPLSIAEDCLIQREKRTGIDQVHDHVEKTLTKEVEIIKKCQEKMKRMLEKANNQQKMTRAAQHACDMDSRNKHHAQGLDDRMYQLHNMSSNIGIFPNIENVDNTITIPVTWLKFTQDNIARSQRERDASMRLRGEIDALLRACANEMWSHYNTSNTALNSRIQELNDAKNKLQAHLQRTVAEIKEMERNICMLKKAICDKEAPLKVAMTRLEERTRRIDVEICNDPAMQGLQREVNEIRESVRLLKQKLRESESALCRLLKTRSALDNDISIKDRSIEIDSRGCMGLRKNMPMDPKMGPMITMPSLA